MSGHDYSAVLGEWQGYTVGTAGPRDFADGVRQLWIELRPDPQAPKVCDRCGGPAPEVHDVTERWVRDLPVLDRDTVLLVHRRRVRCPGCGPQLERVPWLARHARVTRRLAHRVARLCRHMPIRAVARYCGLAWSTVKALHKGYLHETLGPPDLSGVEAIVMDEFSLHKGHRYATVVLEPTRRQVLWVGPGRGREDVRPFFELLGEQGRARLKAVGMDMNGAYEEEVKAQCPHAEIVFDLFHVVQKYHKEVLRPVRAQEAKKAKDAHADAAVYAKTTWLLLSNKENLAPEAQARLEQLLQLNERLFAAYVLRDDLKLLWAHRDPEAAEAFFAGWCRRAADSGIAALQDFARRLRAHWHGIRSHCWHPLHTSLLEGINNTIKVIKRMAYGFRDEEYFFLRIREAFPGAP